MTASSVDLNVYCNAFGSETIFDQIEEAIGEEKARILCDLVGGRSVYIPVKLTSDHWLVQSLGQDAAEKLSELFRVGNTGGRILIPMATGGNKSEQFAEIARLMDEGIGAGDTAIRLHIHERTVFRIRRKINRKRAKLFGDQVSRFRALGLPVEEIARRLNIPPASIVFIINVIEPLQKVAPGHQVPRKGVRR